MTHSDVIIGHVTSSVKLHQEAPKNLDLSFLYYMFHLSEVNKFMH